MKRTSLIVFVVLATVPLWLLSPAAADCGAPELVVTPAQVEVGQEITVTGEYWNDVCNDDYVDVGCVDRPAEPPRPSQDVRLKLVNQDTRQGWEISAVDANSHFGFELSAAIDVSPGDYLVMAKGERPHLRATARLRVVEPRSDRVGG